MVGEKNSFIDAETLKRYGSDETEDLCFPPELVLKPGSVEEMQKILRFTYANDIAVTPRGAGTGLSGGAIPVEGGVSLSTERLNRILEIDLDNLVAVVEPGVVTETFQNAVETHGLFYPPDPASRGSCFIGGNIAECSGGPRAVKYGVTKDFVLGMEMLLPDGTLIRHGGKLLKNVTGFNISQLMTGSEGTLGIVTKATFKLLPLPKERVLMLVPFPKLDSAAVCVAAIFCAGIVPSACELMERDAVLLSEQHLGILFPAQANQAEGVLLIETDGSVAGVAMAEAERITEICMETGANDVVLADTSEKQKDLWRLRRATGEAVKKSSIYKEEDTVVPRARLPDLIRGVKRICAEYGIESVCYGHAGDGNLHVNILKKSLDDKAWKERVPEAIVKIFELTVSLGGTISGEHGIGYVQKNYLPIAYNPAELALMSRIKAAFDPKGLLNPGKWV
jgi:glycolate oxidase